MVFSGDFWFNGLKIKLIKLTLLIFLILTFEQKFPICKLKGSI